jgi:hypothetical protein
MKIKNQKKSYPIDKENWVNMYVTVVKKNCRIVLVVPVVL